MARNGQCDRIGSAGASDHTGRGQGADPTGQLHVGHRPSDRDRAKLLPDAAVKRSPAHVEREMKSLGGLVHEADHPRQVSVDDGLIGDERGLGKTGGEVGAQLVVIGTDQNGADAISKADSPIA